MVLADACEWPRGRQVLLDAARALFRNPGGATAMAGDEFLLDRVQLRLEAGMAPSARAAVLQILAEKGYLEDPEPVIRRLQRKLKNRASEGVSTHPK